MKEERDAEITVATSLEASLSQFRLNTPRSSSSSTSIEQSDGHVEQLGGLDSGIGVAFGAGMEAPDLTDQTDLEGSFDLSEAAALSQTGGGRRRQKACSAWTTSTCSTDSL